MVLTIQQTCKLLDIGRTTVYRMFDRGELERIEFGRSVRVKLPEKLSRAYAEQIKALMN
ncbi:DNA-binding protein [Acinetobacter chinensis]|uniref:DNA-binding protein n=1 Tax=Acinetobacter chinensis TaxID=2004650 RepID=A0A3B7LXV3_9GAMM|nr:helix-turn-helix domain-containing protein [Acinetobacter chinensis]AXY57298.1 DNA-binding protein [Acinetobacter chinensis]